MHPVTVLAAALLAALPAAGRADAPPRVVAAVAVLEGTAEVARVEGEWRPAAVGTPLHKGDRFRTGPETRATLVFEDAEPAREWEPTHVFLGGESEIWVENFMAFPIAARRMIVVELVKGSLRGRTDGWPDPKSGLFVRSGETVMRIADPE